MIELLGKLPTIDHSKDLIFKGGTALFFFHGLTRFSVDLDFDYIGDLSPREFTEVIINALWRSFPHWNIHNDTPENIPVARFFIDYGWPRKLKIEITWPICESTYEHRQLLGIPVQVMSIESMFTHKLIACYSRYEKSESIANRDLFDIDFLFSKNISIDENIILCRTEKMKIWQMNTYTYIAFLENFLDSHSTSIQSDILSGIGDLLNSEKEKIDLKKHLFARVMHHLEVYLFTEQK